MLVIRLARTGRSKYPTYRLVAAESSRAATGRFVAALGHYNPHTKELVIKRESLEQYLANGAQPSNTVIKLLKRQQIDLPSWAKLKTKAAKSEPVPEPATEAPVAEAQAAAEEPTSAPEATDERVAEVAEEAASDRADQATSLETQETAASEEAQAEAAKPSK